MNRFTMLGLSLTLAILGCEPKEPPKEKEPASKPAGKTVKVTKGLCKVEVSLKGELAAGEMFEIRFSPKAWAGPFTILKLIEHGTIVKKGDTLMQLDTEKIDQTLRELETEQRLSELAIQQSEAEIPVLEKLMPLELVEAERLKKHAVEDQDRFLKVGRPHAEDMVKESIKSATHYVEYAKEELKQLQKMYRDKELTEETEEIILKRQRRYVEQAELYLKWAKQEQTETMEVTLPRKEIAIREAVLKLTLAFSKAQATLPLTLTQKKLNLEKLKQELAKSRERCVHLRSDRIQMTVAAPTDGIVFYGRPVHGQFAGVPNPAAQHLVVGGVLQPEMAFITVVAPSPTLVYATIEEKNLHLLQTEQACRVTPVGYPNLKLDAKIKARDLVRLPTGGFLAVVSLNDPAKADLRPAMNCTVKVPVYEKADALLVPTAAVRPEDADEDQTYVNLVKKDGKHVKRAVKVGKTMGSKTEILEGLKEGDEILATKLEE